MAPDFAGATGSEGFSPIFVRKSGISEYLLRKYSNSPRPSATPLINAGGKIGAFFDSLKRLSLSGLRRSFIQKFRFQRRTMTKPFSYSRTRILP